MEQSDVVILLHGLGRTALSMFPMASRLKRQGYQVINRSYPSTRATIQQLCRQHLEPQIERAKQQNPAHIHFVTHSLGGILLRYYLAHHPHSLPDTTRIVMLAPPNQGSEITDTLSHWPLFRWITGPAGQQLSTSTDSIPNTLPPISHTTGIITGRKSADLWFNHLFPGEHDGKVSVQRTRLAGMTAHKVVNATHTLIMNHPEVMRETLHFLEHGSFIDAGNP